MEDNPKQSRAEIASGEKPGAAAPSKASGFEGFLLKDRYLIGRLLGRGGFGLTYLASDTQLHSRSVVVKILLEHQAHDAWALKKFRQEMEVLAHIDHPGIVAALDSGELPDGQPFFVMQYVDGVRLRDVITPLGMNLARASNILRQMGQALSAAHEKGVCHRDLKPENVMLHTYGQADEYIKLIDFGISSLHDPRGNTSGKSSMISGSWAYMAPEQFDGRFSFASDIYTLGVVAYEILTGRPPFNPETPAQILRMQMDGVRVKPRELRPLLPEAAEDIIMRALAYDPGERPSRARDFGESVAQALVSLGPIPMVVTPGDSTTKPVLEMAYVLFMDLVAYSLLPTDQQRKQLRVMQNLVRETPEFRKAEENGTLMSLPTGDGAALVFFGDPVAPARCAFSTAAGLANWTDVKVRMGIHTGPVYRVADINANTNVAGEGINAAQRVMECGEAGHILASEAAARVLSQLSEWTPRLHDLGEHSVKHGVRLHLYNLYSAELGNPNLPAKLGRAEPRIETQEVPRPAPTPVPTPAPIPAPTPISSPDSLPKDLQANSKRGNGIYLLGLLIAIVIGVAVWNNQNQHPAPPAAVSVGEGVQQALLIHKVQPIYPALARQARVQGLVRFSAVIGTDGAVRSLTLISGHPLLVDAARRAVSQWRYRPTFRDGRPVEVVTQVTVSFTLAY